MKNIKYIFILMTSFQASANDLIFKSGFENTASIAGSVTGLTSTGLQIKLNLGGDVSEELIINNDGNFFFSVNPFIGEAWTINITQLPSSPNQQSCTISNNSGIAEVGVDNGTQITCNDTAWEWDVMSWDEGGWQ